MYCSSELQSKRKAFAKKKATAESDSTSSIPIPDSEPGGTPRGDRRGSFFQSLEQQLAEQQLTLNRRHSMSPQNRYLCCAIIEMFGQYLSNFRSVNLGVEYLCNKDHYSSNFLLYFYVVFAVVNIMLYDM